MSYDILDYANNHPWCVIVQGMGKQQKPALHPVQNIMYFTAL